MPDPHSISRAIRQQIDARLTDIEAQEGVRLLLAVESGSRAWGFPSPDSDYDVRFLYVRPRRDYLALAPMRDVIERPIVDEIDLNGWDIRKALNLLLKHNATLSEWIGSPIIYRSPHPIIASIAHIADTYFDPHSYARHYASLGQGAINRWRFKEGGIAAKRYFYALRPALAIRVLRHDPSRRPPMQLQQLVQQADLPPLICEEIERLVSLKTQTREAGLIARLPEIETLIISELARAQEIPARPTNAAFAAEANALFLKLVDAP